MNIPCIMGHFLNVISPAECASCLKNKAIYPFPLCEDCVSKILASAPPEKRSSESFINTHSCLWYTHAVKCCIKSFKFNGNRRIVPFFQKIIGSYILTEGLRNGQYNMIVPVPLHRSRKEKRGYNQSEILSIIVSRFLGFPIHTDVLLKTRNTPPQSGLKRKQRKENLKNSFAVSSPKSLQGRSVLLVDDVTTTGATLEECASTLIKAGAMSVSALTLARVM